MMMNTPSGFYLHCAGLLLSYCLRVGVAYLACLALSRLSRLPRRRFLIWLGFMIGSGLYWLALAVPAITGPPSFHTGKATAAGAAGSMDTGFFSVFLQHTPISGHVFPLHSWVSPHFWAVPAAWNPVVARLGGILAWGYLGGLALLALMTAGKHIKLYRALRRGQPPSAEMARLFASMCRGLGVRRCRLLILENIASPATVYWWRPRVLLPSICRNLGATPQVADVLHHELVHIVRRDYFWAGVSDALCRLLFFHPALWQARKHMRLERELACDLAVVSARPSHRLEYAESLTRFARLSILSQGAPLGIDFAAAASFLTLRVRAILDEQHKTSWTEKGSKGAACLALLAASCVLFPALSVVFASSIPHPALRDAVGATLPPAAPFHAHVARLKTGKTVERPAPTLPAPDETPVTFMPNNRPAAYTLDSAAGSSASGFQPNSRFALLPDPNAVSSPTNPATAVDASRPAWGESLPGSRSTRSRVSLSAILYSTLGQIAARIGRGDRRHEDKDYKDFQPPKPNLPQGF